MTFRHSLDRLIDVCASDAMRKRLQAVSERPPASLYKAKSLADWFASVMAAVDGASAEEGDDSGEGGDSAAMSGMGEDDGGGWTDSQGGARGGDASMVSVGGGGGGRPSGASSASSCSLSRPAPSLPVRRGHAHTQPPPFDEEMSLLKNSVRQKTARCVLARSERDRKRRDVPGLI